MKSVELPKPTKTLFIEQKTRRITIVANTQNMELLSKMIHTQLIHQACVRGHVNEQVALVLQELYYKVAKLSLCVSESDKLKLKLTGAEAFALYLYMTTIQFTDQKHEDLSREIVRILDAKVEY